jgi:hypothetical protein
MTISGVHQNIMCYILKMSSNPIILGTEYLTENKVILDFSNKMPVSLNSNIYCTKRTTIPPNSENTCLFLAMETTAFETNMPLHSTFLLETHSPCIP